MARNIRLRLVLLNCFLSSLLDLFAFFIFGRFRLFNEAFNYILAALLNEGRKLMGQVNDEVRVKISSFEVMTVVGDVATT